MGGGTGKKICVLEISILTSVGMIEYGHLKILSSVKSTRTWEVGIVRINILRTLYINEKIAATVFFKKMAGFLCKSELWGIFNWLYSHMALPSSRVALKPNILQLQWIAAAWQPLEEKWGSINYKTQRRELSLFGEK